MKLRPHRREDPEINLVPMIDVVLVLLIFFMVATSLKPETTLDIRLPEASGQPASTDQTPLTVEVDASGRYTINGAGLANVDASTLKAALQTAAAGRNLPLILRADGRTPHQAVVTVLEVAAELGLKQLAIATANTPESPPATPNSSSLRTP